MLRRESITSPGRPTLAPRRSTVTLRANMVMAGVAASLAWLFHGVGYEGNGVPPAPTAAVAGLEGQLPPPDADVEVILYALETPERFNEFIEANYHYDADHGFCDQFENTPAEFQAAGWKGPCSTGTVFFCEWALRHGWRPCIVNTAPVGTAKFHTPWHQMGLLRFRDEDGTETLWIYDNGIKKWDGSLEAYIAQATSGAQGLLPIGGVRPYIRTLPNFRSRFLSNVGTNVEPPVNTPPVPRPSQQPFMLASGT